MRAKEFIIEITRPTSLDEAARLLKKFGWVFEAEGSYCKVFVKPGKPYVLKVFRTEDEAFISFINFCKQYKNKHFPIFKGNIIKITNDICAIKTEKLKFNQFVSIYNGMPWDRVADNLYYYVASNVNTNKFITTGNDRIEKFLKNYPDLKEALDLMLKNLDYYKFCNDINYSNIMLRNKTIVITDPICV